ncbi:putative bifunctional diguanylate cyclase/phosphodiesterase [Alterisphingorhabdus coralli]|uniref:EAL domain-containing protein n=1 Tax=Alterisphingorhabdus coralli TaxID=3071408 RepID=A0AA97F666_9SPHN|nr:EAL domain-containing protein [Parasphingorhabdus sp. SCSIO 66989]WOE74683.1 EAL domain-containing protein [Parasphingorhabdus sp. SCSIO 66989]
MRFNAQSILLSDGYTLRIIASAIAVLLSILLVMASGGSALDRTVDSVRNMLSSKNASDDLVIVEIDANSLQKIGRWPWPRDIYAELIEQLSQQGARQIAFDVDFSAASEPQSDQQLASAIANSDANIVLATFRQKQGANVSAHIENLPLQILRENALLASVNVHPNEAGQVEHYGYGELTGGTVRPALGALIAESNGEIGKDFRIDQAIDMASFDSVSVIDVLEGKTDKALIEDRTVLVGATAIELGDHYASPGYGVIPGVYIHALASETLKNGSDMPQVSGWLTFLATALVLAILLFRKSRRTRVRDAALVPITLVIALIVTHFAAYFSALAYVPIGNALLLCFSYVFVRMVQTAISNMQQARHHDGLTGLPNAQNLEISEQQHHIAALHIANYSDLTADCSQQELKALLCAMAERLSLLADQGRIYRTGDDQLAWIVPEDNLPNLSDYFETVSAFFLQPVQTGQRKLRVKAVCGYHNGEDIGWVRLLAGANVAATKAMELGYRWLAYSSDLNAIVHEKLQILNDLDQAIAEGQIWVAYQPKMDVRTRHIASAEALARWHHPELGTIGPDRFIPLLEQEGRIADLTLHILKSALVDIANWSLQGHDINCSINVSVALLGDNRFISDALEAISRSTVDNALLTFEITETASIQDLEAAARVLSDLRAQGIKISIDDYGTGQSSLTYLRDFPADEIKIDQTFVRAIIANEADRVMVGSTIAMAHKMHFKVVAEGVEDEDTLTLLSSYGCDVVQGWHIGKPIDANAFGQAFLSCSQFIRASA